ncbi:MAG: glycosyltransferase [Elusimicrobia bacterium]|nr:glycosyltransferase [Elusimicrobiota bacterium]
MKFTVVIPTWNEDAQISSALKRLRQVSQQSPLEIIVVDGASTDATAAQAREWADQVLVLPRANRGEQLDAGARKASGDLVFFLRADCQPPDNWQQALEHFWLSTHAKKVAATAFTVDYGSGLALRLASRWANSRVSWRGAALGEHGLCTTPEIYRESGGYPHYACLEDLGFSERLAPLGGIVLMPERIWPAARGMRRDGPVKDGLRHLWLRLRFKLGASPDELWKAYGGL